MIIRRLDLRGKNLSKTEYRRVIPRATLDIDSAMVAIAPVLEAVKNGNEDTLKDLAEKFDQMAADPSHS